MRQARRKESSGARPVLIDNEADVSAAFKAEVVAWYLSSGTPLAEAAASLNLSESTFREWVWYTSLDDVRVKKSGPPPALHANCEAKVAEAIARATAAETAEAEARAEVAKERQETRAAYVAAVEAVVRAEVAAAEAMAQAEAAASERVARAEAAASEAVARAEVAASEAVAMAEVAASEAVARAEAAASERVARAEAAASEAVAAAEALAQSEAVSRLEAEAAAREEVASTYATAMEAVIRAERLAVEALTQQPVPAVGERWSEVPEMVEESEVAHAMPFRFTQPAGGADDEAAARARIARLVLGMKPVELWVHGTGRTLKEATAAALEQLGINEAQAHIEVLSDRPRWLAGRIQVRARVRVAETAR